MSKLLITSGCSFSECVSTHSITWPKHLFKNLQNYEYTEHISGAMGSQGNGLISRGIIYNVSEALKKYNSNDILVGVMWSNSNRLDYRTSDPNLLSWGKNNVDGWIENPTSFVKNGEKRWVILNHGWTSTEATTYYKYFYDFIGSAIYSLEHILRTQYYLKSKGVKYFFTNFVDNNIIDYTSSDTELFQDELNYLYDEIDQSQYLPVTSEHRWIYENSTTKEQFINDHLYNNRLSVWIHPSSQQHEEFTNQVIIPWLLNKKYI
jgi:hypothetical protein